LGQHVDDFREIATGFCGSAARLLEIREAILGIQALRLCFFRRTGMIHRVDMQNRGW